jgi:hypothetical protein
MPPKSQSMRVKKVALGEWTYRISKCRVKASNLLVNYVVHDSKVSWCSQKICRVEQTILEGFFPEIVL